MDAKKTIITILVAAVILLLFLRGCGEGNDRNVEGVIRERVADRIQALTASLLEDCEEDVLETATRRADSLLIDRARRLQRLDGRPPKPNRPGEPVVKELSSPLPLRPLFPFEIRFDTILRDSLFQDSLRIDSLDRGVLLEIDTMFRQ